MSQGNNFKPTLLAALLPSAPTPPGPRIREPVVLDVTKRLIKVTTASHISIAEAANAHMNCLASLALEACDHDRKKATKMLRESFDETAGRLDDPKFTFKAYEP